MMGGLAQLRRYIVLFSVGLLFVVSLVFGNDRNPGVIDGTAKMVGKRLSSSAAESSGSAQPYNVAVTQANPRHSTRWFAKDESPDDASETLTAQDPPADPSASPPAETIEIHK